MTNSTICVGVDGTRTSDAALRYALTEASLRGSTVEVVTTWHLWTEYGGDGVWPYPEDRDSYQAEAAEIQSKAIERVLAGFSNPPEVVRRVVLGMPGATLVELSKNCDLLVVGTEHKGALKRATLGSTSAHCVRHARIPVVVVPFVDVETSGDAQPSSGPTSRSDREPYRV